MKASTTTQLRIIRDFWLTELELYATAIELFLNLSVCHYIPAHEVGQILEFLT